jgi:signal transduction histidine kinase
VQLLDGTLEIESTPGEGTTVSATFPVQRRDEGPGAEVRDIRSASG